MGRRSSVTRAKGACMHRAKASLHPRKRRNTGRGPEGRGPGVVPGGVGSKNRGGRMRVYTGFWSLYRFCLSVCPVTLQTAMNTTNYLSMNPFDSFLPPNSFRSNRKASSTTGAPMRSACTRSSPPGKGGGLARGALHVPMRSGCWPFASQRPWLRPRCRRTV